MKFSLLPILAAAVTVQAAGLHLDIFRDGNCEDKLQSVHIWGDTCWTKTAVGFSSIRITETHGLTIWSHIIAYIESNCLRAYGRRPFMAKRRDCLGPFDYGAANAIGFFV